MRIESDHLIIETPEEAIPFYNKRVEILVEDDFDDEFADPPEWVLGRLCNIGRTPINNSLFSLHDGKIFICGDSFRVPRSTAKKVLKYDLDFDSGPWYGWGDKHDDLHTPIYGASSAVTILTKLKANGLTLGKIVGQLRELHDWLEG